MRPIKKLEVPGTETSGAPSVPLSRKSEIRSSENQERPLRRLIAILPSTSVVFSGSRHLLKPDPATLQTSDIRPCCWGVWARMSTGDCPSAVDGSCRCEVYVSRREYHSTAEERSATAINKAHQEEAASEAARPGRARSLQPPYILAHTSGRVTPALHLHHVTTACRR